MQYNSQKINTHNFWKREIDFTQILNIIRPNTWHKRALWLLFLIALFNRVYNLGYHSLWIDELIHAGYAIDINRNGWFPPGFEMNQTFIHLLNALALFLGPKSDFTFRFPVAFLSSFGVPLIYLFAKNLFNKNIGLISACLFVGSNFLTFWGRVDRAYGLIPILYLLIMLCFWKTIKYSIDTQKTQSKPTKLLNYPYFILGILSFIIAFFTQIQIFIFFFTATAFGTIFFIHRFIAAKLNNQQSHLYSDIIAWLFYGGVLILLLLFSPLVEIIMRPLINSFLPQYMSTLILPNYTKLWQILHTDKWNFTLNHYLDVTTHDFNYFYLFGFSGFICAFFLRKRSATMLATMFFVPFLLMSFILRDPNLAKYMAFYYPSFLISGAVAIYFLGGKILNLISLNKISVLVKLKLTSVLPIVLSLTLILSMSKISEMKHFITTEEYGNIVDPALAEIFYVPWKEASEYVMQNMRKGAVILHTLPVFPYYMDFNRMKNHEHFMFRQRFLDSKTKTFVPKTDTPTTGFHAQSYEGLVRLYNHYPRGFLLAHYYFDNVFTDPRCRDFVTQNMKYHFAQNKYGLIRVFSWDRVPSKKPSINANENIQKYIFDDLGKPYGDQKSEVYKLNLDSLALQKCKNIKVELTYQGIDAEDEGIIQINDQMFYIPVDTSGTGIFRTSFNMDKKFFQNGENSFVLRYNSNTKNDKEESRGFVVYGLQLTYNK